nr:hypothetical protein [Tanacetum cinerariifolium]
MCKGGAWERVDGALEYMPLNCVKRTLILPLLSSYSCLLEAISERLEIDANSRFMVTYNSDNDIVEVCDDLEVNEFMEFVVKSSRIVTLCIVECSVNGRQSSTTESNQQSNFIHATPSVNVYQTEYHATQIYQTHMPVFLGSFVYGTLDCGVMTCKFIEMLTKGKTIDSKSVGDNLGLKCQEYRAKMALMLYETRCERHV